jgi:hypothetical protein
VKRKGALRMWDAHNTSPPRSIRMASFVVLAASALLSGAALVAFREHREGVRSLLQVEPVAAVGTGEQLTITPDVAEWMYNYESGDQDGTMGQDGGWVPGQDEPCPGGICHDFYTAQTGRALVGGGVLRESRPRLSQLARAPRQAGRGRVRGAPRGRGRLQVLGEVSDFPDIDEYVPTKDAAQAVEDVWDAVEPVEERMAREGPAARADYADFYRAYAGYQLPHEVSNRGAAHDWPSEVQGFGSQLPPKLYPYSPVRRTPHPSSLHPTRPHTHPGPKP